MPIKQLGPILCPQPPATMHQLSLWIDPFWSLNAHQTLCGLSCLASSSEHHVCGIIPVIARVGPLFLVMAEWWVLVWVGRALFIPLSVDGC